VVQDIGPRSRKSGGNSVVQLSRYYNDLVAFDEDEILTVISHEKLRLVGVLRKHWRFLDETNRTAYLERIIVPAFNNRAVHWVQAGRWPREGSRS
jgi:hypothetical protein